MLLLSRVNIRFLYRYSWQKQVWKNNIDKSIDIDNLSDSVKCVICQDASWTLLQLRAKCCSVWTQSCERGGSDVMEHLWAQPGVHGPVQSDEVILASEQLYEPRRASSNEHIITPPAPRNVSGSREKERGRDKEKDLGSNVCFTAALISVFTPATMMYVSVSDRPPCFTHPGWGNQNMGAEKMIMAVF